MSVERIFFSRPSPRIFQGKSQRIGLGAETTKGSGDGAYRAAERKIRRRRHSHCSRPILKDNFPAIDWDSFRLNPAAEPGGFLVESDSAASWVLNQPPCSYKAGDPTAYDASIKRRERSSCNIWHNLSIPAEGAWLRWKENNGHSMSRACDLTIQYRGPLSLSLSLSISEGVFMSILGKVLRLYIHVLFTNNFVLRHSAHESKQVKSNQRPSSTHWRQVQRIISPGLGIDSIALRVISV